VNFVTAHDGFTLHDLVSYNEKHNEANGENNQDGSSNNLSWNCGAEGPTNDPAIIKLRERQKRNMLATLLFSHGTPLILAGDEFGRTQRGNNNAYCQDNEINWIDWEGITKEGKALAEVTRKLLKLRESLPILRRNRFLKAEWNEQLGVKDVTWVKADGGEMTEQDWLDPNLYTMGMLMDGRAQTSGIKRPASDVTVLLLLNAYYQAVPFNMPKFAGGDEWICLIDTDDAERTAELRFKSEQTYKIPGRCLALFVALTPGDPGRSVRRIAMDLLRTDRI
jgi:isoamylase